jgi:phosphoglycolate phosphatase-like HAD superfamily hydrolase
MVGDGAPQLLATAFEVRRATQPDDTLDRFRRHYGLHCLDATLPFPGVPELLAGLAARRPAALAAVVTNKPTTFAERIVSALGMGDLLRAVVGPELVRERKPSADHVLGALSLVGATPDEAVVVGDGTTDVAAGRSAGTVTVAVLWGYRSRAELESAGPDHLVATPAELASLLGVETAPR